MPFCDTDDLIQGEAGKSIKEIVAEGGWEAFRARERAIISHAPLVGRGNHRASGAGQSWMPAIEQC